MGTYGIYSYIYPDDEAFAEGLTEDAWITEKGGWLAKTLSAQGIPANDTHLRWFFRAVCAQDWRCGSCGGCI
jgi:hypothetical protein